ncbi:MAG TPA: TetR/AcrR family transcriptional regulator [Cellulomonas sp.]
MSTEPAETRPRRGPYGKTRGRIETVGRVAHDLVVEVGHRNLTMTEVARRADLTEAQLLYLFPSREHVLVAALERADTISREQYHARSTEPPTDPAESIARTVTEGRSDPAVLRLFATMTAEAGDPAHPAHTWVHQHQVRAARGYATMLRGLQEDGWAHPDVDPERFGRQLVALWDGLQTQWLVDPSFDLGAEVGAGLRVLARRDAVLAREAVEALAGRL